MGPLVPLLLLAVLASNAGNNGKQQPVNYLKDESTDFDALCSDISLVLNFSNLIIEEINDNFFSSPLVKCLNIQNNGIRILHSNAFGGLPNLRYLQMSSNHFNLDDIFHNYFENLETLVADNITKEEDSYGLKVDGVYPKLKKLFLRNNRLPWMVVSSNRSFPSLTHLHLSGNSFTSGDFDWLPETIEYLDLSGNYLDRLYLENLTNLKQLFIGDTKNQFCDAWNTVHFKNLINLQQFSAPSNCLDFWGLSFLNTTALLYLDLSDNRITNIKESDFDNMLHLRYLNLSNNEIEAIEGNIFDRLNDLKTLVLERNIMASVPLMSNGTNLEILALNCNKIKNIIGGTFLKLPNLKSLYLHDNKISHLDKEAFMGLTQLKVLTLSHNKLSFLPSDWLLPLASLEELDLTGNSFLDLKHIQLGMSVTLRNVYLSNQILFIQTQFLTDLPTNATIHFDENLEFVEKCTKDEFKYAINHSG